MLLIFMCQPSFCSVFGFMRSNSISVCVFWLGWRSFDIVIFCFNFASTFPLSSCCARFSQTNATVSIIESQTSKKVLYQHEIKLQQSPGLLIQNWFFTFLPFQENQHMDSAQWFQKEAIFRLSIFLQTNWISDQSIKAWINQFPIHDKKNSCITDGSLFSALVCQKRLHKTECWPGVSCFLRCCSQ